MHLFFFMHLTFLREMLRVIVNGNVRNFDQLCSMLPYNRKLVVSAIHEQQSSVNRSPDLIAALPCQHIDGQ